MSAEGGPAGLLVLHGFTGNPSSMRPIAEAAAAAGHAVELPRLPGHGTTVEDMLGTDWSHWSEAALEAHDRLAARCQRVVVCGLSMGGTLTAFVGVERPGVAGLVFVNAAVAPVPGMRDLLGPLAEAGEETIDAIGSDVADPEVTESAYDRTPVRPLLSMLGAVDALQPRLGALTAPALVMVSPNDHVVPPASSDHLAAALGGPVERVTLERSFHVATIDHDRDLIIERTLDFVDRVTAAGPSST